MFGFLGGGRVGDQKKFIESGGISQGLFRSATAGLQLTPRGSGVRMYPTADLLAVRKPVLIMDQLQAPADFLIFRTVITHLKENKQNRCIILSTFNDVPRWKAIASKSV